jgi:hypothetical protein
MPSTSSLDPKVWGPHYWFFLHTVAISYPVYPNAVTKKKYYDLIQNLPLFIPIESISSDFSRLLDQYPVQPYLDNRESFVRWTWFIHNKINEKLEKPLISLNEFYIKYYEEYKPATEKINDYYKMREKFIYFGTILSILGLISYLYRT